MSPYQRSIASWVVMVSTLALGCAAAQGAQSASGQSPVRVQPPAAVSARTSAPPPAASKPQKPAIGGRQANARPADAADDTDSFWVESIDFDGDGDVESADVLWDDEDKILFLHDDGSFTCQNGGRGEGELLVAIYGDGNARQRPSGSGWYVAALDAGECAAKTAGLFGCRFDAKGAATECGAAVVQEDDVSITPGSQSR